MNKKRTLFFLIASLCAPMAAVGEPSIQARLPDAEVKEIRATVDRVRDAILSADTQALLKEISPSEGLECTDTSYAYTRVKSDLTNQGSVFYKSLFDSSKFRAECGAGYPKAYPAISEAEFYRKANRDVRIESLGASWAKVTIQSPIRAHYERWLYLHKEGKVWKIGGGSFVIGECTCG